MKIKHNFDELKLDATVEIRKLIDTKLKRKYLNNRIFNAFPRIKFERKK